MSNETPAPAVTHPSARRLKGQPDSEGFRRVARYAGPVGLKGALKIAAPEEAAPWLMKTHTLLLTEPKNTSHYWQLSVNHWQHTHGGEYKLTLTAITDRTALEKLQLPKGALWVATDAMPPLAKGEFWLDDLVGLSVVDEAGTPLGTVQVWLEGNGDPFLDIQLTGKMVTHTVPFTDVFFPTVDWATRTLTASPTIVAFLQDDAT